MGFGVLGAGHETGTGSVDPAGPELTEVGLPLLPESRD